LTADVELLCRSCHAKADLERAWRHVGADHHG
jgi:hypothetical protein